MPEQRAKSHLIEAQSAAIARAMASICNDEQGCFGVMSGHERKTLRLSVAAVASIDKARSAGLRSRIQPLRKIVMPDRESDFSDRSSMRRVALSRWENEGGAWCGRLNSAATPGRAQSDVPPLTNAELVQLQIRVIALENLAIALLTDASDKQLDLVREMAAYISPRPGFTAHRLTLHAAAEMISLVERAGRFKDVPHS